MKTTDNLSLQETLDQIEREFIIDALSSTKGSIIKAAEILGITERIMGLRVKKHHIDVKQFK